MRVLVTGGGGFLGSHIAARLYDLGDQVSILGRRKYSGLREGVESIQADLRDPEAVFHACQGKDAVFHAAAKPQIWGSAREFFEINVEGTRNVIEACKKQGVKKLIFTSSPSVVFDNSDMEYVDESVPYPESYLCEYPRTKALAEQLVLSANGDRLLTVALRPHLIWGPGDPHLIPRLIDRARKGQLVQVGDGTNKVDMIYIDNAVEAHMRACSALAPGSPVAGKCYFVSDGDPVILWDWINNLLGNLQLPPVTRKLSYRAAYGLGAVMEGVYRIFRLPGEPRMTRFLAAQLATSHYFDMTRAVRDLQYKPIVSVDEGLKRLIEFLQAHPVN